MPLSIVYPPKGSTSGCAIDIVAVHGLGGDAIGTWTHPTSKAFWLKDFLPQYIPDARILTFGYDAAAAFGRSTSDIVDYAKGLLSSLANKRDEEDERTRPLVFVAHSLGGIVVKQALLQARLEPRYHAIRDATLGIMFFGTPHRGSETATYGKVLASVAQTVSRRPPPRLLTALQTNSDVLLRLTSDFRFQLPQYQVVSFYEQQFMSGFSSLIVEKHSALLEVEHEDQIPIQADHSAMCKFETDDSDIYESVYKRIRWMRNTSRPIASNQATESYNQFFEVPHLLSTIFTGQESVCQRLDESLILARVNEQSHVPLQPVQRRFVLFGLGGSGKTQICVRYTQVHRQRYWGIFWVDASSRDSIQQSMAQTALLLKVEQNIDSVKRALANASQLWLLVFDNADNPRLPLAPYFPTGDRGDIIITSRDPASCQYSSVGSHEIAQMLPSDAETLLLKAAYGDSSANDEAKQSSQRVVQILGYLALAVTQAGSYVRETSCTFNEYLELYAKQQKEVMTYLSQHSTTNYRYSVYTTWQVSAAMIESMDDTVSAFALRLLRLIGFYHHDQIPLAMFYEAWNSEESSNEDDQWVPWPSTISDFFELRRSVQASVSLLASFSLISRNSNVSLSVHPLVHDWCRLRMPASEQKSASRQAAALLAWSIKWEFQIDDYVFRRSLFSHVHSCLRSCKIGQQESIAVAGEWDNMALVLDENGSVYEALQLNEQAMQIYKSTLGEEHPDTLESIHNLALRYSEVGRQAEALQLSEQVVEIYKRTLGEEHPDTLRSIHNLALRYSEVGRQAEALQLLEQVVEISKRTLGEEYPDTLESIHNLAIAYSEVGRRAEALQLSEQVVGIYKRTLGEEHPDTLGSIHNLALRYSDLGRVEALQLSKQVVEASKRVLGEKHPDTLNSEGLLAHLLKEGDENCESQAKSPPVSESKRKRFKRRRMSRHHESTG